MKYSSIVPNTLVHQCIECIFGWVAMQTSQHGFHSTVAQIQPYLSEIPKELQNLMLKMAEKHLGASQVDSWVSKMGDFLGLGFHTNGMTQVQTSDIPKELQDLLIKMAEKNLSKYTRKKSIPFQVITYFYICFENCFDSFVLPEKFSVSTTDHENKFSWSIDKKVCFDLKSHVPSLGILSRPFNCLKAFQVLIFLLLACLQHYV